MAALLRRRRPLTLSFATLAFLLISSVSALRSDCPTRQFSKRILDLKACSGVREEEVVARRRLGGPGSWPPSCISKCGRCTPCKAVHVPIQPGTSMPLEYYPEAWRCKCGNKLFTP